MKKISFILNIIFVLLVSLSAGFFISTKVYENQWQTMMSKTQELLKDKRFNLVDNLQNTKATTRSMAYNLNSNIYLIAKEKQKIKGDILNQIYFNQDFIAPAIVASSDGWLITSSPLQADWNLVAIDNKHQLIKIKKIINDPILHINYLKVDRTDLNPIAIADSDELEIGDTVYELKPNLYNYQHELIDDSIANLGVRPIKEKTDLVYKSGDIVYELLNRNIDSNLPVVNAKSQFIGFVLNFNHQSYLLASKYIRYSLKKLFNGVEKITYPTLGIDYVDLSELVIDNNLPKKGAFVYNVLDKKSVLQKGDIIMRVENDEINELRSLNDILLDYKIGSEINLTLIRNGKTVIEKVIVTEMSNKKI